jgi:osmotically-inducible protein OsmY
MFSEDKETAMVFKPQTFHESPPQSERESPTDAQLEAAVAAHLARAAMIDATRVNVTAAGGTVTLTGPIGSTREKDTATEVASAVSGVTQVDNRLAVQGMVI